MERSRRSSTLVAKAVEEIIAIMTFTPEEIAAPRSDVTVTSATVRPTRSASWPNVIGDARPSSGLTEHRDPSGVVR